MRLLLLVLLGAGASHALKLAAVGDYGVDDANEAAVASMIAGWGATDILALGDNNYGYADLPRVFHGPGNVP